jgi:hypothetical protein
MRTGTWRDRGIACGIVLAWHLLLGWVLVRAWRIEPSGNDGDALQVVYVAVPIAAPTAAVSKPRTRSSRQPARHPPRPPDTADRPARTPAPVNAPRALSAVLLDQAGIEARRQAPIDFGARDPFAQRPTPLADVAAGRFRMQPARSPSDRVAAVGGFLLAPRGYDADPCPRNRENIGGLMAAGDSAALRQELEFERRHCRP